MVRCNELVIFCLLIWFYLLMLLTAPDPVGANPLKGKDIVYSVVIDAGSTGSRVVAYKFKKTDDNLILEKEKFVKTKPGLSSYAQQPKKGAKKIIELLKEVDGFVPAEQKHKTKLYLRATAGLRSLGNEKVQELLKAVQEEFEKTDYKVEKHAAGMLSGSDEGLFAWFTLNYLKGKLDGKSLATLEMGGGSAQVTYVPRRRYEDQLKKDMHKVPYKNLKVFSKSYLGLGINSARDTIFVMENHNRTIGMDQTVTSQCIHPDITSATLEFGDKRYYIRGAANKKAKNQVNRSACQMHVQNYLLPKVNPRPLGLADEDSVALSAFYYRGKEAQLIVGEHGNTTLIELWKKTADVCAKPDDQDPFLCMDLIYMYTLLKEGFDLKDSNRLEMVHKLDDHELSWALGFAYSKLIEEYGMNN